MYLSYTIFTDLTLTTVKKVVELDGESGDMALTAFRNLKGAEPREGDIIAGARIDRIGSEHPWYNSNKT